MATIGRRAIYQLWNAVIPSAMSSRRAYTQQLPSDYSLIQLKKLEGKVAVITGAGGGMGSAASKLFAAHGAQVIMTDISKAEAEIIAQEIGPNAVFRECDVTKEDDIASTVDFAVKEYGKLDIMFNNAGAIDKVEIGGGELKDMDMEVYDKFNSVNVRGVMMGIKHAARVMAPAKQGAILNMGSAAAIMAGKDVAAIYSMTKSTIPGITKVCAFHLGKHGIRVNAIHPGHTPTKMIVELFNLAGANTNFEKLLQDYAQKSHLKNRTNTTMDIAKAALFLCSEDSATITGHNLIIDAGLTNVMDHSPYDL
ncbi:hypothetical protein Mapa_002491 [Marchantia paleacea]|nr:hypothetical protein Mapa_002491 [Marchantia paleacea]